MSAVGIFISTSHDVPALRAVLRNLRETVTEEPELVASADDRREQVATYLVRQYLRGRLSGVRLGSEGGVGGRCGLACACHLVDGEFIVRTDDALRFRPGWLDASMSVLRSDPAVGCVSLLPPPGYHRTRGRPRSVHMQALPADLLEMRCFVTRRELAAALHADPCAQDGVGDCHFQRSLRSLGKKLAYLPGFVEPLDLAEVAPEGSARVGEDELPLHEGASGTVRRLEQAYGLGDDVLLTCMACGACELEVLAARIRLCERHQVALGYWYELRCPECGELHYRDDLQFRCRG